MGLGCKLRLRQKRESVTVEEEEDEGRERKELGKRPKRTELDRIEKEGETEGEDEQINTCT